MSILVGLAGACVGASEDLAEVLQPLRDQHGLPALAAAVIHQGKVVAIGAVGVRKWGQDTPVTAHDRFHIGSCTKAMTATLIAQLVEEGTLSWDTTLAAALPELAEAMQPAYRAVSLRQLLMHRGGFPQETWPQGQSALSLHLLPGTQREQRRAYAKMILTQSPEAEPGSRFIYSNAGYTVAGAVAEHVTGKAWEELMVERLFQPLGMTSAGFGAPGSAEAMDQPWPHLAGPEHPEPITPGPLADNPPVIGPAGRVHCSLADWARFVLAHLQGDRGESRLLRPETFQVLHTPPIESNYALGWAVMERDWGGGRVLTHAGSNRMNFAVVWIAPLKDFAVLVATNMGGDQAAQACDETAATLIRRFLLDQQREEPGPADEDKSAQAEGR